MAEIYPSLLQAQAHAARRESEVLDSAQVRVNAKAFSRLDRSGGLASLFAATDGLTAVERRTVEREEAWILGLGHETALQNAALEAA
jgi:precorrin-8X/cobalt-precorrin-8 methylmutase